MKRLPETLLCVALCLFGAAAQQPAELPHAPICAPCIRAHMEFLASDALHGRGGGTPDELVAATYIATELEREGLKPAGDDGGFLQRVPLPVKAKAADAKPSPAPETRYTWNVIAILPGRDPAMAKEAVLLSAHLDHLGRRRVADAEVIYHGADDDASGVSAVLELARGLAQGEAPRRTVIFALFGSEETGAKGSRYFRDHPPLPLPQIIANLEFEMIGRPDPAVRADTLWLTGWERSNLGPALAAHGAHLVPDPRPQENFFQRSDNYIFALKGMVAQTVSSYGLHKDYHRPGDDLAHIDFAHLGEAIGSMINPIRWLVDSDFKPQWVPGGKPKSAAD